MLCYRSVLQNAHGGIQYFGDFRYAFQSPVPQFPLAVTGVKAAGIAVIFDFAFLFTMFTDDLVDMAVSSDDGIGGIPSILVV